MTFDPDQAVPARSGPRVIKVLIIDDISTICDGFKVIFQRRNSKQTDYRFEVETCASVERGVAALRDKDFDVLVLDVLFPAEGAGPGSDLALAVHRHLGSNVPIRILVTAMPDYADCLEAGRAGAWAYLRKATVNGRTFEEAVVDSALLGLRKLHFDAEIDRAVHQFLYASFPNLEREYPGKVLALWHKPTLRILAVGDDEFEVAQRVRISPDWKPSFPWEQPYFYRVKEVGRPLDGAGT